jgi:UDP-3-O-[3-hydroxymyristoyl] glucosamine N-acyltransferase
VGRAVVIDQGARVESDQIVADGASVAGRARAARGPA